MNDKIEQDVYKVQPLKKICMTIGELPTSYLETMTYYEMLVWFTNFLRDNIIPTVNNNAEAVKELQNLFVELQTYVNDYFDNLDVQEEINNKLDDMMEAGTLQEIIADYLNSKAVFGYDNVASMKEATNLIDGSYAKTLGYHSKNDGGEALYKIRTITNTDIVDNGSIIALNNSSLIAELIIDNKINVKQFGAYGDNIHDDTLSITKTINYATKKNIIVNFNDGTYLISKITINNTINLIGHNAIIKSINNNTNDSLICMIDEGSVNSTIKNIVFDGNKENVSNEICAIKINNTSWKDTHSIFEDIEIKNFSGNGIVLTGTASHNDVRELQMHKLNIHNCELNGIMADSLTDSTLTNSSIWHNGKSGIYLYIAGSIRIDNCKFYWNGFNGNELIDLSRIPASAFSETSDASAQLGKTYYTRSGYGDWQSPYVFTTHSGAFEPDTTYYEVERNKYLEKFNGIRIDQCTNIMVTSTEIQDNFGDGIWVNGGNQTSLVNVCVDNNGLLADIETHQIYSYSSQNTIQFYYGIYIKDSHYSNMLLNANNFRYNTYGYMQVSGIKLINTENVNISMTSRLQIRSIDLENINLKLLDIVINGNPYKINIPFRLFTLATNHSITNNDWNGSYAYCHNGIFNFKICIRDDQTFPTDDAYNPIEFPSIVNPQYTYPCFAFTDNTAWDKISNIPPFAYINKNGKVVFKCDTNNQKNLTLQGSYNL